MREGTLASLYRTTNAIILGDRLAEKMGAKIDANITVQSTEGANITAKWSASSIPACAQIDEANAYVLVAHRARCSPARPGS